MLFLAPLFVYKYKIVLAPTHSAKWNSENPQIAHIMYTQIAAWSSTQVSATTDPVKTTI